MPVSPAQPPAGYKPDKFYLAVSDGIDKIVRKTIADLTGYDTADVFDVTGDVMVRCFGIVGATAITSTSGTTNLRLGTTELPGGIINNTTVDNTAFAATDVWTDTSCAQDVDALPATWFVVGGGTNIRLTVNVDDLTAGSMTLYCIWRPLSEDGNVVAA